MPEKPKDIEEYKRWLKNKHDVTISDKTKAYYDSVASKIKLDIEKSKFWLQLKKDLEEYHDEYDIKKGYPLFMPHYDPVINIKGFDSFLLKTFRKNVLSNQYWPKAPRTGWILPSNWYSTINDIVRTFMTVKYLDGVEFLTDKIVSLCEQQQMTNSLSLEATEEGYYAAHLYVKREFEIPKVDWDTTRVNVLFEIQITTQLQEIIRSLLHKVLRRKTKENTTGRHKMAMGL